MSSSNSNTKPGNVGEMYENRVERKDGTHQVGVLESHDEKCRTIMMRGNDGNSFTVTYSTFRSNWRKYKGDEVIKTSDQVEEDKQKVEESKKKVVERKLKKVSREDLFKTVNATKIVIESIAEGYEGFIIKVNARGGICFRVANRGYAEVWMKPADNEFSLCVREEVYPYIPDNLKNDYTEKYFEKRVLKNVIRNIPADQLESVSVNVLDAIVAYCAEFLEEDESEEEGEE